MTSLSTDKPTHLLTLLLLISSLMIKVASCLGSRTLNSLYQPPPTILQYHNGPLLEGHIPISILWYGNFSPSHKATISDFILSLTPRGHQTLPSSAPSVSRWWSTVDDYLRNARKRRTHISLSRQISDPNYSLGKSLSQSGIAELAARLGEPDSEGAHGVALVLTAADVAVEGFCMSACGLHGSRTGARTRTVYVWVGNSVSQCPGQCAWPFHQPIYGPRGPPLGPPNGDVGADGMVVNLAELLAGAVTNPFGNGFFEGDPREPVEVGAVCPGVYGKGAYPGYAGRVRVDPVTGASYNVEGVRRRKFLVPALLDPYTSACLPIA